jgi:hypothetical protein
MKKNYQLSLRFCYIAVFVAILLSTAFGFAGCGSKRDESFVWLSLTVKFKENTSEPIKDAALSAIRSILIDTITQIQLTHKEFDPKISTELVSINDKSTYEISVQNAIHVDSVAACLCKTDCKICQRLLPDVVPPRPSTDSFTVSSVLSIIPNYTIPKGDPAKK